MTLQTSISVPSTTLHLHVALLGSRLTPPDYHISFWLHLEWSRAAGEEEKRRGIRFMLKRGHSPGFASWCCGVCRYSCTGPALAPVLQVTSLTSTASAATATTRLCRYGAREMRLSLEEDWALKEHGLILLVKDNTISLGCLSVGVTPQVQHRLPLPRRHFSL